MKKIIIVVAVLFMSLFSSPVAKSEIIWGVKAGVNASWIPGMVVLDPDFTYVKTHIGADAGVLFRIDTPSSWFFQTELLYDLKGHSTKTIYPAPINYWDTYNFNLHYIELPLMAGVKLSDDRLNVMFGPQVGYCVYGEETIKRSDTGVTNRSKSPYYAPFQLDLVLQFSYFVLDNLSVDVRGDVGLTRVMNNYVSKEIDYKKAHNTSISLGVSYYFGL